jgi:hypothetical protein
VGMDTSQSEKRQKILRLYEAMDSGHFPAELFTPDFQFFYPTFGIGRGPEEFLEFASAVRSKLRVKRVRHRSEELLFIEAGRMLAVEGTTEGATEEGTEWRGGETAAGRFASVFAFTEEGLIERMHVYLDPDFIGSDPSRFEWGRGTREW